MMERSILVGLLSILFMCGVFAIDSPSSSMTEADCAKIQEQEECCKNCSYFSCENKTSTDNATLTGCHANNFNVSEGPGDCKELSKNICPAAPTKASTTTTVAPTPADTCKDLNQTDCCAKSDTCKYQSCTKNNTAVVAKCYMKENDLKDVCDADPKPVDECPQPTKPPPTTTTTEATPAVDSCTDNKDNTTCCAATGCQYISCSDKVEKTQTHTGCHKKNFTESDFCDGSATNTCPSATDPTGKPTDKSTAASTTKNGTVTSTTESPEAKKNTGGDEGGQRFDGASFIGGIVLCLGIVGIIFISLKVYKAKTERNYQTL